jgi:hypothetical protein
LITPVTAAVDLAGIGALIALALPCEADDE